MLFIFFQRPSSEIRDFDDDLSDLDEPSTASTMSPMDTSSVIPGLQLSRNNEEDINPFSDYKLLFKPKYAAHLAVFINYSMSYGDAAALVINLIDILL